ncbi:hypothetical protein JXB02_04395 [Candidatus Woesearchaeota archaeon]|nr:hypothetical protein [Candidatus Woesearchaeota archaeon]
MPAPKKEDPYGGVEEHVAKGIDTLTTKLKSLQSSDYIQQATLELRSYYLDNIDRKTMKIKDDKKFEDFAAAMWDKTAIHVMKNYWELDDQTIEGLRKAKGKAGEPMWDNIAAQYLGIKKDTFMDQVMTAARADAKTMDEMTGTLLSGITRYMQGALFEQNFKERDFQSIGKYLDFKVKQNKDPWKFKGFDPSKIKTYTQAQQAYEKYLQEV